MFIGKILRFPQRTMRFFNGSYVLWPRFDSIEIQNYASAGLVGWKPYGVWYSVVALIVGIKDN